MSAPASTIDTQTFDLRGAHYDLGFAQGARTARFETPLWWPAPPDLSFAQECAAIVAAVHPPLLDELRGYADAQALAYADLLRGICRRSLRLRARVPVYPEGGCSSYARVAAAGQVRAGHNYDFYPIQRVRQRVRLAPQAGRPSVGMRGSVPAGRYDGVNDLGLFVSLHVVLSDEPDEPRPGVPFHLLPRLALETCADTRQAVDMLTRLPHLNPFNYLVADPSGSMAVVEAHPGRVRVREPEAGPDGRPFVAATNHFEHPQMRALQDGRQLAHSQARLRALRAGAALGDHAAGLCGHAGGHTTLWSVEADLTAQTVAYALGAPCQSRYELVPWPH
jgi:predicted choloylglycine hydrolase